MFHEKVDYCHAVVTEMTTKPVAKFKSTLDRCHLKAMSLKLLIAKADKPQELKTLCARLNAVNLHLLITSKYYVTALQSHLVAASDLVDALDASRLAKRGT